MGYNERMFLLNNRQAGGGLARMALGVLSTVACGGAPRVVGSLPRPSSIPLFLRFRYDHEKPLFAMYLLWLFYRWAVGRCGGDIF